MLDAIIFDINAIQQEEFDGTYYPCSNQVFVSQSNMSHAYLAMIFVHHLQQNTFGCHLSLPEKTKRPNRMLP